MSNLRVCMSATELVPTDEGVYIGGAVTSAANLCRSLSDDVDIHVITTPPRDWPDGKPIPSPDWGTITTYDGVAQHPGVIDGVLSFARGCRALVRHCSTHDVDLIHSHSGYSILASMTATASQILGIPAVHSLYCPIPKSFDGIEERLSSRFFTRMYFRGIDHAFAMSANVLQSLEDAGVNAVSQLPPVIDTETFRPDCSKPESVTIDPTAFTILFVGSFKPEKGLEYLINAAGQLSEEIPIQLIYTTERSFPREDERRTQIKNAIENSDLDEYVTELGIINDMPNLIAHVDVLAVPFISTRGPSDYPIAILEAMACNTPVVATATGGITELLNEERGHLVPPKDSDNLAGALTEVYRVNNSPNTREFIMERFSSEVVANQVLTTYQNYR